MVNLPCDWSCDVRRVEALAYRILIRDDIAAETPIARVA